MSLFPSSISKKYTTNLDRLIRSPTIQFSTNQLMQLASEGLPNLRAGQNTRTVRVTTASQSFAFIFVPTIIGFNLLAIFSSSSSIATIVVPARLAGHFVVINTASSPAAWSPLREGPTKEFECTD